MRINSLRDAVSFFPDIDGFWRSDDLIVVEAMIQSLITETRNDEAKSAELLTQLVRVQALQGKLHEARESLARAREILDGKANARAELRWLLEQGRVLSLSMSVSKAHDIFAQAWKMAGEIGQPFFAVDAALMLSSIRPPKEQNEWLEVALNIAETSEDEATRRWLPHLLFLRGWRAFDAHQFAEALISFTLGLEQLRMSPHWESSLRWSRARTLRALDRVPEALDIQESLLKETMEKNIVNGYIYLEIAECKQALDQNDEAKLYFQMAHAKLSTDRWFSDNKSDELERMKYLFKKR